MSGRLDELKTLLGEIHDLERVTSLLSWDQETLMPADAAAGRAEMRATIVGITHERVVSDELGRLLAAPRPEAEAVLDRLRQELVPLLEAVADADEEEPLRGPFPLDRQDAFARSLLVRLGVDPRSWRLDGSEHPFAASPGIADIRLTTHFYEEHLGGLFACLHEFGHGLYERQVSPSLFRTPLATGASSALHESQ